MFKNCFYDFVFEIICRIDPTDVPEEECVAKFINHSRGSDQNVAAMCRKVNDVPRLVLYAIKDIPAEAQLFFDYGERDPEALKGNSWLKKNASSSH